MPIFERFRGLTATRIAPIIVLSLAAPLAFAQTAGKRYSGAAAVSDVNGNGYGDYAVVKWHPTQKKNFVYITDGITGNYIDKYDFGSGQATGILSLRDTNGNDQREVAVMRTNGKGKTYVRVRDGASAENLSNAFVAGAIQQTRGFVALPDISGNDADEYAVLTVSKQTGKSEVRIRDARTGRFVNTVDAYDSAIRAQALATVPSLDLNTNTELAVLGTNKRNGQARVRLVDSLTGQGINDVIFLPGNSRKARGMTVVADTNGNEADEIAVLYVKQDDGAIRVLTKDALTGQEISDKAYFNKDYTVLGITTVVGAAGQDGDGIAVMARRKSGEVRVKIRNVASGEWISGSVYHGNSFRAEHMIQLDDLDDDGVGDLGVFHTRKSNLTARMRIRDPITPKNIINTPVVGGDGNIPPIAMAGMDQAVTAGFAVTLDGRDSFDPDGNRLTYVWRQVSGPDVTDGQGKFEDSRVLFASPRAVRSVVLELIVTDAGGLTGSELVVVNTLENAERAFFVDGDNGSDSAGDGSMENPFATISNALARVNDRQDIYTMNRESGYYAPSSTLRVPTGTSLYGGYDEDWVRDPFDDKTVIRSGAAIAVWFSAVNQDAWFSGFQLIGAPGADRETAIGLWGDSGDAKFYLLYNEITAGSGGRGEADAGPGASVGALLSGIQSVQVFANLIDAGPGGHGFDNQPFPTSAPAGGNGANGSGSSGGDGGARRGARRGDDGGDGGDGGTAVGGENGESGDDGSSGSGGRGGSGNGSNIPYNGGGGRGGNGGNGGDGGTGQGNFFPDGLPKIDRMGNGTAGGNGLGGGGGGGGEALLRGRDAGGGGGGGAGGDGGAGGRGGYNGGPSIALILASIPDAAVGSNVITADRGGDGGNGGPGQIGGAGGDGGNGAAPSGSRGGAAGGGGGMGGEGGAGGGGGGGPSYGVVLYNSPQAVVRDNNEIATGAGGQAGRGGGGGRSGFAGETIENGFIGNARGAKNYGSGSNRGTTGSRSEDGASANFYRID